MSSLYDSMILLFVQLPPLLCFSDMWLLGKVTNLVLLADFLFIDPTHRCFVFPILEKDLYINYRLDVFSESILRGALEMSMLLFGLDL